jgi:hypothetical protein
VRPRSVYGWVRLRLLALSVLSLLSLPLASTLAAQEGSEIIRGHVLGENEQPLSGVTVTVTALQSRTVRTTRTNERGLYTVLFAAGEGEYLVEARRIGFAPRSIHVIREDDESVIVADIELSLAPSQLQEMVVTGTRPRPPRNVDGRSIGGLERDLMRGALFSLDPGDLNALATQVPGVLAIPGANGDSSAYSVLGSSPDQNNIVVDGSTFSGGTLPPDALRGARLITTTFDAGRGQFSGGQMTIRTQSGSDILQGTLRGNLAHPKLAWADPRAPRPPSLIQSASGSIGGPIRRRKAHYFGAFDYRRNLTDAYSLLDLPTSALEQYGLARDTITMLTNTLDALGVPLRVRGIPDGSSDERKSAFLKLDLTPTATISLSFRADGAWSERRGGVTSLLALPTLGTESRTSQLGLQVSGSAYGRGFLDEFRTYLQRSTSATSPHLQLPTGTVRVGVEREDGATGLTSLRFGGGSSRGNERHTTKWETTNELSWITSDSRHRVKFGQSVAIERMSTTQEPDQFGSFTFESLEDLAANRPASYTRTIAASEQSTDAVTGAAWVADEWRVAPNFRLQLGLRLDAAQPTSSPAYNPAIEDLYGLHTDRVPRDLGYSPRLGFSWMPGMPRQGAAGVFPGGRAGGGRGGAPGGPPGTGGAPNERQREPFWRNLRIGGGVGAFRGIIATSRIASLVDATGLPSTTQRLSCVGDATPIPSWDDAGTGSPMSCQDGTAPESFSSIQPRVQVFSPGYEPPVSWRSSLQIDGFAVRGWRVGANGTYSLGLNNESSVDMNLHRVPSFALAEEAGRPVFVTDASIVPATGAIAPGASRIDTRYGPVSSIQSEARSVATQLQVTAAPPRPLFGTIPLNVSYTYSRQRARQRGFAGSTAGDPFAWEWTSGRQPAHQIQMSTSARYWGFTLALRLNALSGTPYTPVVAGDINGDGSNNDRAFIHDPDEVADPMLAGEMSALLATAPKRARDCLRAQLGEIAGPNSCRTGWQLRPDINLSFTPLEDLGVSDRLRFSMTLLNASAGLVRALGMSNSPLALRSAPDATLLYKTGFDPVERRYTYRVNQQFGDAVNRGQRGAGPPFQIQMGLEYRFGGPPRDRMVRSLGLVSPPNEPPLDADEVRLRLRRLNNNPVSVVLERREVLKLDSAQIERLEALSAEFVARADSASAPLADYLVTRKGKVTDALISRRLADIAPNMRQIMLSTTGHVAEVLTEAQREQLPPWYFSGGASRMGRPSGGLRR